MLSSKEKQININFSCRPSRFQVNLPAIAKKKEEKRIQRELEQKWQYKLNTYFKKKLAFFAFFNSENEVEYTKTVNRYFGRSKYYSIISKTALFRLFIFVFKTLRAIVRYILKAAYVAGYLSVFLVRFCFLLALTILRPLYFFLDSSADKILFYQKNIRNYYFYARRKIASLFASFRINRENKIKKAAILEASRAEAYIVKANAKAQEKTRVREIRSRRKFIIFNKIREAKKAIDEFFSGLSWRALAPHPQFSMVKPVSILAILLMISALPIKALTYYNNLSEVRGTVLGASESAINEFANAAKSAKDMDFIKAQKSFSYASDSFFDAGKEIKATENILAVLGALIPNKELKLAAQANNILEAARLSAEIGKDLSSALSFLNNKDWQPRDAINALGFNSRLIAEKISQLNIVLAGIDESALPKDLQNDFSLITSRLTGLENGVREFSDTIDKLKIFLGFDADTRYLLVFQNNAEMRGSGGFMGSYALVDFSNGKIKKIEAPGGGSYDTEAGMYKYIKAPEALRIVNPRWYFWDSNWWPDWPTTAQKLMWFYEESNGPSVDGVVSFTPTVIEKMLRVIGPLDMREKYNVTLNADNFWEIVQTFAEQKPLNHPAYHPNPYLTGMSTDTPPNFLKTESKNKEKIKPEPKKIIGDIFERILEVLPERLNKNSLLDLVLTFNECLNEKHILLYFNNEELGSKIKEYGWDGSIKQNKGDYLMVVNTNISGGKSDKKIKEKIDLLSEIDKAGKIINTLTITRKHTGQKGEAHVGVRNLDWMRIYVPLGSRLIKARGFRPPDESLFEHPPEEWQEDEFLSAHENNFIRDTESWTKIYRESGKTVFANWSQVDPGKTTKLVIQYELPWQITIDNEQSAISENIGKLINQEFHFRPYSLILQKQPGSIGSDFSVNINWPGKISPAWFYPDNAVVQGNNYSFEGNLQTDYSVALIFENK